MGMKSFRLRRMEQYILEKENVSMEELCTEFDVSMNTVRMDVAALVKKGSIKKVYGGVCSNHQNGLVPFEERKMTNSEMKKSICRVAAGLVEDGDIILMHDASKSSVNAALQIIDRLQSEGYLFVTVEELVLD